MIASDPTNTPTDAVNDSRDALMISALVSGKGVVEAAEAAGVGRHTVSRRLHDPAFVGQLNDARTLVFMQTLGVLSDASLSAAKKLSKLVDSDNERVSLKACEAILSRVESFSCLVEIQVRLREIEIDLGLDGSGKGHKRSVPNPSARHW